MKITNIRLQRIRVPLDPPLLAAWDPEPRRHADATIVLVETDEGVTGVGSGDTMAGFEAHAHLFLGQDPLAIGRHVRTLESIHLHGGRFWPLEVALWDLLGKVAGLPVATLLGGALDRVPAYASTGELRGPAERAESALAMAQHGFRALKLRVDPHRAAEGLAVVAATRAAVGDAMEIMVDLNQSWRMAGDLRDAPDYPAVRRLVSALGELDVCWVEEPLPYADTEGLRRLRAETGVRVAAGEMQNSLAEVTRWLDDDVLDVYQMDVALALGISRARTAAERAILLGRRFTPHTWTNGVGLLANLAVSAGIGGGPWFEYPYDPPGWTPQRRDALLRSPIRIDAEGCVRVPDAPGLGIELDADAIAAMAVTT